MLPALFVMPTDDLRQMGSSIVPSCSLGYLEILDQRQTLCGCLTQHTLHTFMPIGESEFKTRVWLHFYTWMHLMSSEYRHEDDETADMHGGGGAFPSPCWSVCFLCGTVPNSTGWAAADLRISPGSISVTTSKCNFLPPPPRCSEASNIL